jgi:hypothetical protein
VELQQIDFFGPKTLQGSLEFIRARLRRANLDFRCNEYLVADVARANDIADDAFCVAINRRRIDQLAATSHKRINYVFEPGALRLVGRRKAHGGAKPNDRQLLAGMRDRSGHHGLGGLCL